MVMMVIRIAPGREPVAVEEGNEPEEFWSLLGGKADYPKIKVGDDGYPHRSLLSPSCFRWQRKKEQKYHHNL